MFIPVNVFHIIATLIFLICVMRIFKEDDVFYTVFMLPITVIGYMDYWIIYLIFDKFNILHKLSNLFGG